mmetsp:Transcript_67300/g.197579  ORF Transcript_67300/g.197579 Transcript_67300/m.197579 type:complete len:202 (-) Transcript_67300:168-773(-)
MMCAARPAGAARASPKPAPVPAPVPAPAREAAGPLSPRRRRRRGRLRTSIRETRRRRRAKRSRASSRAPPRSRVHHGLRGGSACPTRACPPRVPLSPRGCEAALFLFTTESDSTHPIPVVHAGAYSPLSTQKGTHSGYSLPSEPKRRGKTPGTRLPCTIDAGTRSVERRRDCFLGASPFKARLVPAKSVVAVPATLRCRSA